MTTWHLDIDRIRIVGAETHGLDAAELRTLIAHAVQSALLSTPLPQGRAGRAHVGVQVPSLSGDAIAGAVARSVVQAVSLSGRAHG